MKVLCTRLPAWGLALILATLAVVANIGPGAGQTWAFQASPVASPPAAGSVELTGTVNNPGPVTIADLQAIGAERVTVTYESGGTPEEHTFTGVRLFAVLEEAGLAVDPEARNPWLTHSILITAKDGYQVVLSGGELDPNFGDAPILLAWEQDGAPLAGENGPLRLVVPGDLRGGRYVHGIVSIEVRGIGSAAS